VGGGYVFRPHVDFKLQTRETSAASEAPTGARSGSGWIVAAGGDLPVRIFGGSDFFPKARVLVGSIEGATGWGVGLFGMELIVTLRTAF